MRQASALEKTRSKTDVLAFDITFMDGKTVRVWDRTYSRASVRAAWERMQQGSETYRQLRVVKGERVTEADREATP